MPDTLIGAAGCRLSCPDWQMPVDVLAVSQRLPQVRYLTQVLSAQHIKAEQVGTVRLGSPASDPQRKEGE